MHVLDVENARLFVQEEEKKNEIVFMSSFSIFCVHTNSTLEALDALF